MEASDTEGSTDADLAEALDAHIALHDLEDQAKAERARRDEAIRRALTKKGVTMYGAAKHLTDDADPPAYRLTEQAVRRIRDRG